MAMEGLYIDKYYSPPYVDKSGFFVEEGYTAEDGTFHEDPKGFIIHGILDFCGCGLPDEAILYIRDVLQLMDERVKMDFSKEANDKLWSYFPSQGAAYFTFYVLDKLGLTDHGSSEPGWLTDHGKGILGDIKVLFTEG